MNLPIAAMRDAYRTTITSPAIYPSRFKNVSSATHITPLHLLMGATLEHFIYLSAKAVFQKQSPLIKVLSAATTIVAIPILTSKIPTTLGYAAIQISAEQIFQVVMLNGIVKNFPVILGWKKTNESSTIPTITPSPLPTSVEEPRVSKKELDFLKQQQKTLEQLNTALTQKIQSLITSKTYQKENSEKGNRKLSEQVAILKKLYLQISQEQIYTNESLRSTRQSLKKENTRLKCQLAWLRLFICMLNKNKNSYTMSSAFTSPIPKPSPPYARSTDTRSLSSKQLSPKKRLGSPSPLVSVSKPSEKIKNLLTQVDIYKQLYDMQKQQAILSEAHYKKENTVLSLQVETQTKINAALKQRVIILEAHYKEENNNLSAEVSRQKKVISELQNQMLMLRDKIIRGEIKAIKGIRLIPRSKASLYVCDSIN